MSSQLFCKAGRLIEFVSQQQLVLHFSQFINILRFNAIHSDVP